MCSGLNLKITETFAFPSAKSEFQLELGLKAPLLLHFSLKRNVYINQINILEKLPDLQLLSSVMPFYRETLWFPLLSLITKVGGVGEAFPFRKATSHLFFSGY